MSLMIIRTIRGANKLSDNYVRIWFLEQISFKMTPKGWYWRRRTGTSSGSSFLERIATDRIDSPKVGTSRWLVFADRIEPDDQVDHFTRVLSSRVLNWWPQFRQHCWAQAIEQFACIPSPPDINTGHISRSLQTLFFISYSAGWLFDDDAHVEIQLILTWGPNFLV